MRLAVLAAIAALSLSALAGCGGDDKVITETTASGQVTTRTVPDVKFAKTKFVLHGALAYGAFKRYVYNPYRDGGFKKGAPKRKRTIAKAALAGAFALNELRLMRNAALADDKLRPLADKISAIVPTLTSLASAYGAGRIGGSDDQLGGLQGRFDDLIDAARSAGVDVPIDKLPSIPGI